MEISQETRSKIFKYFLLLLLCASFIFINWPFKFAIVIAAIFALGLNDFVYKISLKLKIKKWISVVFILSLGFALFWVPVGIAISRIIMHVSKPELIKTDDLINQVHHLKDFFIEWLQKFSSWTGTDLANPARTALENMVSKTGQFLFDFSSQFLAQMPNIFLQSFVFLLILIVLLLKSETIFATIRKYTPLSDETFVRLVAVSKNSCYVTLFSTLVIGFIQALIVGIGSLIFKEGDFWLVLAITFFVSFIPVIGAAPVSFLLAILAFIGGRTGSGIGMTVIGLVAGSIDNVIKPFMVGKEHKINPVVGFTCVVGAILMMGLPGLLIGPVVMNLFVGVTPLLLKGSAKTT
ncbi:hypothetical protein BDW_07935 [Bdellovibrio bacteriovorus W]|nr:hypothetical protein BDW_07935 [Bdellovibrio bacteriovorus W]